MSTQIELDFTKTAQQNADEYYKKSKKLVLKKEGAGKAVKELNKRLEKNKEAAVEQKPKERKITEQREKQWFEKFNWFYTSNNMLVIAGRDAHQNELINSKHFDDKDLFFHANIFGAPVTILKEGTSADDSVREEVAQFAASFSSAWKDGYNSVDVYAMKREQVSKSKAKGTLGTGSFLLTGEREWYRNVPLELVMFVKEEKINSVPMHTFVKIRDTVKKHVTVKIGKEKKSDTAKKVAHLLGVNDIDSIMQKLPTGEFKIN